MLKTPASMNILLVEDSPTDRLIAVHALERAGVESNIHFAEDGAEAMAYLRRQGRYAQACRPDLILLDLNLPKKDGREVLREIKGDAQLSCIVVVVLTTSNAASDVLAAYANHANSYLTKPPDLADFTRSLSALTHYWFSVVTLPPH
jgi:CheY-like chemotaxis protein